MHDTLFAGLTELEPDESIGTDGAAIQSRNPSTIDRFLRIGCVTHRHDGHQALATPTVPPSAVAVPSGGMIPSDLEIEVGYTLVDPEGGETTLAPTVDVSTQPGLEAPDGEPFVEMDYTAGSLRVDTYFYGIAYLDESGGETPLGPMAQISRDPGLASAQVQLSDLAAGLEDAGAAAWKLYRARGGTDFAYIASGTADTFTDTGDICADCNTPPPREGANSTGSTTKLVVTLPADDPAMAGAEWIKLYASVDGSFGFPSLLASYPIASAGATVEFLTLDLLDDRPPAVSTSVPGANLIDPDTELIDWHWKRPVADAAALPSGAEEGDVRVTLDDGVPHRFIGGMWGEWAMGGGGGGNAIFMPDEFTISDPVSSAIVGTLRVVSSGGVRTEPFDDDDLIGGNLLNKDGQWRVTDGYFERHVIFGIDATPATWLMALDGSRDPDVDVRPVSVQVHATWASPPSAGVSTHAFLNEAASRRVISADYDMNAGTLSLRKRDTFTGTVTDLDADVTGIAVPAALEEWWLLIWRTGDDVAAALYDADPAFASPIAEIGPYTLSGAELTDYPASGHGGYGIEGANSLDNARVLDVALDTGIAVKWLVQLVADDDVVTVIDSVGLSDFARRGLPARDGVTLGTDWTGASVDSSDDEFGRVHLEGRASKSSAPADGDVICTLDYGPAAEERYATVSGDDATPRASGAVDVQADGDVVWRGGAVGTGAWISLAGLNFRLP